MVYNMRLVEVVLVAGPLGQVTLCMVYNTRLVEVVLQVMCMVYTMHRVT